MLYDLEFHLTIVNNKRTDTFNAVPAIERFKDTTLGTIQIESVEISSRKEIETYDGRRIPRRDFDESKEEGFYACEERFNFYNEDY